MAGLGDFEVPQVDGGTLDDDDDDDEDEEDEDEEGEGWSDGSGGRLLGATLAGDALARSLVDAQTSNELGLVRVEVRRLRAKVARVEREKEDMADDFRNTTRVLLNRIKELEAELSGSQSRPQTSAILQKIEPPSSQGPARSTPHAPQIMRIEEESPMSPPRPTTGEQRLTSPSVGSSPGAATAPSESAGVAGETSLCGNCRRQIPSGNVLAHSVSCYRNNFRCDTCDEVIPLREKDQHMQHWNNPERLVEAVGQRDIDLVQKMLGHNADVCNAVHPTSRDTAMHAAARIGDEELVAFLTAHGLEIDSFNAQQETPLLLACATALDKLPESGVMSPMNSLQDEDGRSAPSGPSPAPAVRLLVELGADLDIASARGDTPLMLLCRRGIAQTAKYLVDMKADTGKCNQLGDSPLQVAQRQGHQETVLALCTAGASLRVGTPSERRNNCNSSYSPRGDNSNSNNNNNISTANGGGDPSPFGSLSRSGRGRSPSPLPEVRPSSRGGRSSGSAPSPPGPVLPKDPNGGYPPRPRESRSKGLNSSKRTGSSSRRLIIGAATPSWCSSSNSNPNSNPTTASASATAPSAPPPAANRPPAAPT